MKRLLWVAAGLFVVVLLLLLLPALIDLEPLKARWLPVAERALGRQLTVGHVRLSLLPVIGVTVREIAVMDDPAFGGKPFLTIEAVTVRPALRPLLHRRIEIASLTITNPAVTLIKRADGRWNYQSLEPAAASDHPSTTGPAGAPPDVPAALPELQHLRVINGTVTVRDQRAGAGPPPAADRINLAVDHLKLGETVGVGGSARVNGWTAPIVLSGRVQLAAAVAPNPIADADLLVTIGKSDLRLIAHPDRERPGDAPLSASWNLRLESKRLDLDELMAQTGQSGTPNAPATVAAGTVATGRAASAGSTGREAGAPSASTPSDRAPWPGRAGVEANIGTLRAHQLTVDDLRLAGRMENGAVRLETVTGRLAGGTVDASGAVDLARADRPFKAHATASRINLEVVQRALSASEPKVTGTATVTTSLNGVMGRAFNWQEAVKVLEGRGHVEVLDGALHGIDLVGTITQQLNKLAGKTDSQAVKRDRTPFTSATAAVTLGGGVASIGSFQVESADFSLAASGQVGLTAPQPLGLKAEMRLSEPISRSLPGKSAVALLSEQGRLAIPVLIKGTIAEPLVLPDAQLLAKRTGRRLNERVLNEVLSGEVDQLQQTGKSLLKGLLGR
ncbi:MAG: AsmA family protein [Nitrospirae bacterium]|nr:AsmA family protein [Nitrospirota bacterium]